jgi:hypothetical protein
MLPLKPLCRTHEAKMILLIYAKMFQILVHMKLLCELPEQFADRNLEMLN